MFMEEKHRIIFLVTSLGLALFGTGIMLRMH